MYILDNISEDKLTEYQIQEVLATLDILTDALGQIKEEFKVGMHPTLKSVISKIDKLSHENLRSNCTVDDAVVGKILANIN